VLLLWLPARTSLHLPASALVAGQARGAASTSLRQLCLYNFLDIAAALGLALLVNVAVLLVAAATFHQAGEVQQQAQAGRLGRSTKAVEPVSMPA
jgi:Mn2+/Fe2+ NRAMP family transporter